MRESLHDRFRPFKPYDLALAVSLLVLIVSTSRVGHGERALLVLGGCLVCWWLDLAQHLIRLPARLWQSLLIVAVNTSGISLLLYLQDAYREFGLALAMLNVAFATLAFGQFPGLFAAVLSATCLAWVDAATMPAGYTLVECVLFLAVLLSVVAVLNRVNRLQQDALIDVVTGLRNHRYFQARLREELLRCDRQGGAVALLMLDFDDFKRVNDEHGHAVGDQVLRHAARVLEENVRAVDLVCRYGGEEVAVILPTTDRSEALQVAERLREAMAGRPDEHGIRVTFSAGVAVYPDHADQADGLIGAADAAMYRAKRAGKNRVLLAGPSALETVIR